MSQEVPAIVKPSDAAAGAGGRPRDAARGEAILRATLQLLTEVGYDRLSMESVAARSGAAKTTIYRRWPDKAALVAAAVAERAVPPRATPGSADLRTTTLEVVTDLARQMAHQDLGLLSVVFAARRADPALAEGLRRLMHRDEETMTSPLPSAAARSGLELCPDFAHLFAELVPAVLLHHLLVSNDPLIPDRVEYLVDRMLLPLIVQA
jgi:AcrR family transcriptional regulator